MADTSTLAETVTNDSAQEELSTVTKSLTEPVCSNSFKSNFFGLNILVCDQVDLEGTTQPTLLGEIENDKVLSLSGADDVKLQVPVEISTFGDQLPPEFDPSGSTLEGLKVLQCIEWLRDRILDGSLGSEDAEMVCLFGFL